LISHHAKNTLSCNLNPLFIFSPSQHLSLQLSLNRSLERLRLGSACPSALNLAILANQELFKVPLNSLQAHETGLFCLHPLEYGLGLVAVDVCFAEDGETDSVVELAEFLDCVVGAGVLGAELVAGETEEFYVVGVGGLQFCGREGGQRGVVGRERVRIVKTEEKS
jgi:hypothetical protein